MHLLSEFREHLDINELRVAVSKFISETIRRNSSDKIYVYSFNRDILLLNSVFPHNIETHRWGDLAQAEHVWPDSLMPISEALAILNKALTKFGARSQEHALRGSELRGLLSSEDIRFDKSNPHANIPRLITALTNEAEQKGIITKRLDGSDPNPFIWLGNKRIEHTSQNKNKDQHGLSGKYMKILQKNNMGPFSRVREVLFNKFANLIEGDDSITVNEAINRSISLTREALSQDGAVHESFPWRQVRVFMVKLLSRNNVMYDGDEFFHLSFTTLGKNVSGLKKSWIDVLEADLILCLVENGVDIHVADSPQLSGAVFHSREENIQERVNELIVQLIRSNKLIEEYGMLKIA